MFEQEEGRGEWVGGWVGLLKVLRRIGRLSWPGGVVVVGGEALGDTIGSLQYTSLLSISPLPSLAALVSPGMDT